MRKAFVSALMMTLLLLTGCGRREAGLESEFAAFRDSLRAAQSLQAQVELSCDGGETLEHYGLALDYDGQQLSVTVTEPELIAGIRAVIGGEEARIEYEGVMLGVGEIGGLTPVSAMPEVLDAMAWGYKELLWREDDYLVARLWLDDEHVLTVWLQDEGPMCAEIAANGQTQMTCHFTQWQIS